MHGEELGEVLKRFVHEAILPTDQTELISGNTQSYLIESDSIALSYANGSGPEDPHWHPDEVETYLVHIETTIAYRSVDTPGAHQIVTFAPGRVLFPTRTCHFTDLRGFTEVMSFRQYPAVERVNCKTCHLRETGDCAGLERVATGFQGQDVLVAMAVERQDWLTSSRQHQYMSTLERAIQIAAEAHAGQLDKAKQPYILHPLRVMLRVQTESERIAAVLHDVVEDTPVTLQQLEGEGFAVDILEAPRASRHSSISWSMKSTRFDRSSPAEGDRSRHRRCGRTESTMPLGVFGCHHGSEFEDLSAAPPREGSTKSVQRPLPRTRPNVAS